MFKYTILYICLWVFACIWKYVWKNETYIIIFKSWDVNHASKIQKIILNYIFNDEFTSSKIAKGTMIDLRDTFCK